MDFLKHGASAAGKILIAVSLGAAFFAGLVGVIYLQLTGTEVEIPKVVGKNFNDGQDELSSMGLRIKKIATRYSNENPNTILEQRPRAGTVAKSGLIISVVVSEPNPPGTEPPTEVKDDQEAIEEIQDLPELKTDKAKRQTKTTDDKDEPKTRDVIEEKKPADQVTTGDEPAAGDGKSGDDAKSGDKPATEKKEPGTGTRQDAPKPPKPAAETVKPPSSGEVRPRKTPTSNLRG
jgi:hypothetical protein